MDDHRYLHRYEVAVTCLCHNVAVTVTVIFPNTVTVTVTVTITVTYYFCYCCCLAPFFVVTVTTLIFSLLTVLFPPSSSPLLSGDKQETAINIARFSGMVSRSTQIMKLSDAHDTTQCGTLLRDFLEKMDSDVHGGMCEDGREREKRREKGSEDKENEENKRREYRKGERTRREFFSFHVFAFLQILPLCSMATL